MRTVGRNDSDASPSGFELVLFESGRKVLLPTAIAESIREELLLQQEARLEVRRQEARAEQEAKLARARLEASALQEKNAAENVARKHEVGAEPPSRHYRVIANWTSFIDETDDVSQSLRSADKDVNERQSKLRERLIQKGPDRRIARPETWRAQLDQLEVALPHFREPIRLLRHSLALADATSQPVRVPPMLLLGPPGVGKTHFTHRVAELLGAPHASIAFDQPTAGSQLRGSDKFWGNSASGLLFNLICMGECANPVILLDEVDKSSVGSTYRDLDPLAQLHGALEPETARRTVDISTNVEFDASLVTYIATANSLRGLTTPILSRLEIFGIEQPEPTEAVSIARAVVAEVLDRLHLRDKLAFDRKGLYVLAHLSPRLMLRTAEKAVAAAVSTGQSEVTESDLWAELGPESCEPRPH